jgi:hypothetical protein
MILLVIVTSMFLAKLAMVPLLPSVQITLCVPTYQEYVPAKLATEVVVGVVVVLLAEALVFVVVVVFVSVEPEYVLLLLVEVVDSSSSTTVTGMLPVESSPHDTKIRIEETNANDLSILTP